MTRRPQITKLSDAQLVQEYRNGNSPAIEALMNRYKGELLKYIAKIAGRDVAEDALQETWAAMMTAILDGSYKEGQRFERWIKRIARDKAVDAWRTEHHFERPEELPDIPDEALNEEELLISMENGAGLLKAFRRLGKREQRIILYVLRGLSSEEIAKKLKIKNSAIIRVTHARALKKIAAFLL